MRLIDADKLWCEIRDKQNGLTKYCGGYRFLVPDDRVEYDRLETVLDAIDAQPEVDAVPVVHCDQCKFYLLEHKECNNPEHPMHSEEYSNTMELDDFCSYGKRKEAT